MGRLALVIVVLLLAAAQGLAAPNCTEKGWYFGLIYADNDSINAAGHGPLTAWGKQPLILGDVKIVVNTAYMWSEPFNRVEVEFFELVSPDARFEGYYESAGTYELRRRGLACQWISEPNENGTVLSFGNLRILSSASHPTHMNLETFETLEAPRWR